jgi:hypothetical protein
MSDNSPSSAELLPPPALPPKPSKRQRRKRAAVCPQPPAAAAASAVLPRQRQPAGWLAQLQADQRARHIEERRAHHVAVLASVAEASTARRCCALRDTRIDIVMCAACNAEAQHGRMHVASCNDEHCSGLGCPPPSADVRCRCVHSDAPSPIYDNELTRTARAVLRRRQQQLRGKHSGAAAGVADYDDAALEHGFVILTMYHEAKRTCQRRVVFDALYFLVSVQQGRVPQFAGRHAVVLDQLEQALQRDDDVVFVGGYALLVDGDALAEFDERTTTPSLEQIAADFARRQRNPAVRVLGGEDDDPVLRGAAAAKSPTSAARCALRDYCRRVLGSRSSISMRHFQVSRVLADNDTLPTDSSNDDDDDARFADRSVTLTLLEHGCYELSTTIVAEYLWTLVNMPFRDPAHVDAWAADICALFKRAHASHPQRTAPDATHYARWLEQRLAEESSCDNDIAAFAARLRYTDYSPRTGGPVTAAAATASSKT